MNRHSPVDFLLCLESKHQFPVLVDEGHVHVLHRVVGTGYALQALRLIGQDAAQLHALVTQSHQLLLLCLELICNIQLC